MQAVRKPVLPVTCQKRITRWGLIYCRENKQVQYSPLFPLISNEGRGSLCLREFSARIRVSQSAMNLPSYVRVMLPAIAKNLLAKEGQPVKENVIRAKLRGSFPAAYEEYGNDIYRVLTTELQRLQKPKKVKKTKREKKAAKSAKENGQIKHAYMAHAAKLWNPELSIMPYGDFLETSYWKIVRQLKLMEANHQCSKCCSKNNLQIHHINYENRGREHLFLWQLKVLCRECHKFHHNIK